MSRALVIASIVVLGNLLPLNFQLMARAQDQDKQKIIFHVTSVRTEADPDSCQTGECSATLLSG